MNLNYVGSEEIANLLGVTTRRVQQLAKDGTIPIEGKNPYKFVLYNVAQSYIRYQSNVIAGREKRTADTELSEKEKLRAEADLKMAKAEIEKMKLKELEGTMHNSEDVRDMTTDLIFNIRSAVSSLAGRLSMDIVKVSSANEAFAMIKKETNSILEELSKYEYNSDEYRRRVRERQGWEENTSEEEEN